MNSPINRSGFTLVELLTVIAVIAILAGLVLSTAGYVQRKAASSRAESEIHAISAAAEGYKADNGIYPRTSSGNNTDALDPRTSFDPNSSTYQNASLVLYRALSGDTNCDGKLSSQDGSLDIGGRTLTPAPSNPQAPTTYMEFKPGQLGLATPGTPAGPSNKVLYLQDPFGYSYGYSTAYQADLDKNPNSAPSHGYNPTFDLWSTAGNTSTTGTSQWIKNW